MGPRKFFPWIVANGYQPTYPFVSTRSQLLVDFKGELYRLAWGIPSEDPAFHQTLATLVLHRYKPFAFVLFVNDGDRMDKDHPKFNEVCKRRETKKKQRVTIEQRERDEAAAVSSSQPFFQFMDPTGTTVQVPSETKDDDVASCASPKKKSTPLENLKRAARGVSYEDTLEVARLVSEQQSGNMCIHQCEEEADRDLILLADQFDYVVSNDADILVGGANNFLREAFSPKQALYSSKLICEQLKVTLRQLQEITSLSGNDYTNGIYNMGLESAHNLIRKYGDVDTMLRKWTAPSHMKVPENIRELLANSVSSYYKKTEADGVAASILGQPDSTRSPRPSPRSVATEQEHQPRKKRTSESMTVKPTKRARQDET